MKITIYDSGDPSVGIGCNEWSLLIPGEDWDSISDEGLCSEVEEAFKSFCEEYMLQAGRVTIHLDPTK